MAAINPTPLAPSAVRLSVPGVTFGDPRAMTDADIRRVVQQFATAARLAREVGFGAVEIQAAHGYLLSQFLSPRSNLREDAWGGSLENRSRLLLAVVRPVWSEGGSHLVIGVKLNATDVQKGAFSLAEAVTVAQWLDQAAIDFVEITGGTYERLAMASTRAREVARYSDEDRLDVRPSSAEAFFVEHAAALLVFASDASDG